MTEIPFVLVPKLQLGNAICQAPAWRVAEEAGASQADVPKLELGNKYLLGDSSACGGKWIDDDQPFATTNGRHRRIGCDQVLRESTLFQVERDGQMQGVARD